jgi:hypothetical protein
MSLPTDRISLSGVNSFRSAWDVVRKEKARQRGGLFLYGLGFKENAGSFRNAEGFHRTTIFEEAPISLDKTGAGVRK